MVKLLATELSVSLCQTDPLGASFGQYALLLGSLALGNLRGEPINQLLRSALREVQVLGNRRELAQHLFVETAAFRGFELVGFGRAQRAGAVIGLGGRVGGAGVNRLL